jgi:hypothetical protein
MASLLLNAIDWIDPESKQLISRSAKEGSCWYYTVKSIVPSIHHLNWLEIHPPPRNQTKGVTV